MNVRGRLATLMLSVLSVASVNSAEPGRTIDSCTSVSTAYPLFAHRVLSPIEGVWEMTDGGATVAIVANGSSQRHVTSDYSIVYVCGPDLVIPRGTVIGTAQQGSTNSLYDAVIYKEVTVDGEGLPRLSGPQHFAINITSDDRLALNTYEKGVKINAWRLVPYILRYSVRKVDQRPANLDGMVRIYPSSANAPICL
ncbi:MAG: hypothetical protein K2L93_06350 [Muribaculaceae bacterium]|nr:hypothetical protein [Muribaculaceae bacterium]MDE6321906.1 hypothetical protein [Muribaculaceae bacterium]